MKHLKRLFVLLLCLSLGSVLWAVSPLKSTQQELEKEINTCVDDLIAQSRASTETLLIVTERYKNAQSEVEELKTLQQDLNTSLQNTSESLNKSRTQIIELSASLTLWKKICKSLAITLGVLILVTAIVLYLELTKKTDFI